VRSLDRMPIGHRAVFTECFQCAVMGDAEGRGEVRFFQQLGMSRADGDSGSESLTCTILQSQAGGVSRDDEQNPSEACHEDY